MKHACFFYPSLLTCDEWRNKYSKYCLCLLTASQIQALHLYFSPEMVYLWSTFILFKRYCAC